MMHRPWGAISVAIAFVLSSAAPPVHGLVLPAALMRPHSLPPVVLTPRGLVRYFAFGSNLGAEKLRNRGYNGTAISWESRRAATVRGYRLAFNMRMFPPLEPAMASIEPCPGSVCEGALIEMDVESYEALWRSEGGGMARSPYEEVVVPVVVEGGAQEARGDSSSSS